MTQGWRNELGKKRKWEEITTRRGFYGVACTERNAIDGRRQEKE